MKNTVSFSKDFILVAIGQVISLFGNQILRYALPLYLLIQTGSSTLFGTISACAFIPMLLCFPVGGIIADRLNKRNIMVILDFSTAFLAFLFCIFMDRVDIVFLMAATLMVLYGIQGIYQPAVNASVPLLVSSESIIEANSIVNVISSFSSMAGPVIGGILFSVVGLTPILYISIICFIASALMEMFIHIPYERKAGKGNIIKIGLNDLKESLIFIFKKQPDLWKISLIYASVNLFLTALILIAVPVLITQRLGFSVMTANRLYGYAQGIIASGSILGGMIAGVISKKLQPKAIPLLVLGCAASILLAGISLHLFNNAMMIYVIVVLCCGLLVMLSTLFQIQMLSYVQLLTPAHLIGKIISCVICICMFTNPIGEFIYGILFDNAGNHAYLLFYGAAFLVILIGIQTRSVFYQLHHKLNP